MISEQKDKWYKLKREIETKHTNSAKVFQKYREIIELAEGQPNNLVQNRKSLNDEFKELGLFKIEFDRMFAEEIQPKMSDHKIIDEQKKF